MAADRNEILTACAEVSAARRKAEEEADVDTWLETSEELDVLLELLLRMPASQSPAAGTAPETLSA